MQEQSSKLEERVEKLLESQKQRVEVLTETFKEALRLSNKTYFLEEVGKLKNETNKLKNNIRVLQEKLRIQNEVMEINDNKNWQLYLQICQLNELRNEAEKTKAGKKVKVTKKDKENDWLTVSSIEEFKTNFGFNQRLDIDKLMTIKNNLCKKNVSFLSNSFDKSQNDTFLKKSPQSRNEFQNFKGLPSN